jgi:hypothetical protein
MLRKPPCCSSAGSYCAKSPEDPRSWHWSDDPPPPTPSGCAHLKVNLITPNIGCTRPGNSPLSARIRSSEECHLDSNQHLDKILMFLAVSTYPSIAGPAPTVIGAIFTSPGLKMLRSLRYILPTHLNTFKSTKKKCNYTPKFDFKVILLDIKIYGPLKPLSIIVKWLPCATRQ